MRLKHTQNKTQLPMFRPQLLDHIWATLGFTHWSKFEIVVFGASYLRVSVWFPCAIANIFASYTLSILVPQKNYPIKIQNRSLMNGMHLFQLGLWWGILIVIRSVQFSFHYSLAVLIEFGCMLIFVWLFVSSVNWWFQEVGSCIFCSCDKHNFG